MKRFFILCILILLVTIVYADKVSKQIEKKNHSNVKTYNWEETASKFIKDNGKDGRSVPGVIDYQGKITDSANNPITSDVNLVFAIYDVSSGGANLWTETHTSVTPVDGLVHVLLGSQTSFESTLFDGSDRWLGIKVGSDSEMTPRLRIASVPYAIYAETAETDNDWTISGSYSLAAGSNNTVVSAYSLAHGLNNNITTNGHYAAALGANNTINRPYSLAAGSYNSIDGSYAMALGRYLTAQAYNSFVIGRYNVISGTWDSWEIDEPLFVIGNGADGDNRSNALTVFKDGKTTIGSDTIGEMLTVEGTIESTTGGFKFPDGTTQTTANSGNGDITAVTAGTGLTDGGTSGDVTLNVDLAGNGSATTVAKSNHYHNSLNSADGSPIDAVYVDNDGDVGIGTTSPSTYGGFVTSGKSVVFLGDSGTTSVSGVGARFQWIPERRAIRSGYADGSEWNLANIGEYSGAIGRKLTASSYASFATGYDNSASGNYSSVFGTENEVSGFASTAFGSNNNSSGDCAFAANYYTNAIGINSAAFGYYSDAQAYGSFVVGRYNIQNGTYNSWISSEPLFVIGNGTSASTSNRSNAVTVLKNGNAGFGTDTPQRTVHINDVLRLEPRADTPSSPSEGDIYVNSTTNHIYCYLNGSWKQLDN